jgi:hypothetical protein
MNGPNQTIKRWTIVGVVFSILYTVIAIMSLADERSSMPALGWIVLVVAILFWIGTLLAATRHYSAARVFLIIGGIPALPLGAVMIIAGVKIAKAGTELSEGIQPATASRPLGQ